MGGYTKYKVQKGDTLKVVAARFNIEAAELRRFHNLHCDLDDLIGNELNRKNRHLLIPEKQSNNLSSTSIKEVDKRFRFNNPDNKIVLQPQKLKEYAVNIAVEKNDGLSNLTFKISVQYINKNSLGLNCFKVKRISKWYKNNEELNDMADVLAYETSDTLYPLIVSIDDFGKIHSIENHSQILERWPQKRQYIEKHFCGEVTSKYLEIFERGIKEKDYLQFLLRKDLFLQSYFSPIYHVSFRENLTLNQTLSMPIDGKTADWTFNMEHKIHELLNKNHFTVLESYGESRIDFPFELINESGINQRQNPNENEVLGSIYSKRFLNAQNNVIEHLYQELTIKGEEKIISISICNTVDNPLDERKYSPKNRSNSFIIEETRL